MSLLRIDARFLLPTPARRATVLGEDRGWAAGLREADIEVVPAGTLGTAASDLVVAPAHLGRSAAKLGAPMVLLEGRRGAASLRSSALHVRRCVAAPSDEQPRLLVPLTHRHAAVYALDNWSLATSTTRRVRNWGARLLLSGGVFPEVRPMLTVASRDRGEPFFVAASRHCGVPPDAEWFLSTVSGDSLSRGVFYLFEQQAPTPKWALKFARVRDYRDPFDRDERGLRLAAEAGSSVAAHAPRFLGHLEVDGFHGSVETAAVGRRLTQTLLAPGAREHKLGAIEAVASWLLRMNIETAASPEHLEPELRRLSASVLPHWAAPGVPDSLDELPSVPAVLQHNDVGTWNVIQDETDFTLVDWESARRYGLPLWDLLYFLQDALLHLDAAAESDLRDAYNVRLFRGEIASSQVLFSWIRRAVEALSIAPDAVGPLATLCWLHHGTSHLARNEALNRHASRQTDAMSEAERIARLWLADPSLGWGWSAWA